VTVSLPGLPLGGAEEVSSGVGDTCISVSYIGKSEKQSIPAGVRIRVTTVEFLFDGVKSTLLALGGGGCPPGGRSCQGGDAFTAEKQRCELPVRVTREPKGGQETGSVRLVGKAVCATALAEQCTDFARSLDGTGGTAQVTVYGASSPSPEESSPETAPESAPPTSGVPETSAGTSPKPSAGPATGAGPSPG
jgi:hypothetical protein